MFQKTVCAIGCGGVGFGPPFLAGELRARPPMPDNGLPYGPTRVSIACLASNLGPGRAASPTDPAAPPNEGSRNGVFGQKWVPRNAPYNSQFRPKGVQKRDLLHQMGSGPVCFSVDSVSVQNIAATTPVAGEEPVRRGRVSKNGLRDRVGGGRFRAPVFGRRAARAAPDA